MYMNAKMDEGDIISSEEIEIEKMILLQHYMIN